VAEVDYHYRSMGVARLYLLLALFGLIASAAAAWTVRQGGDVLTWAAACAVWALSTVAIGLAVSRLPAAGLWFEYRLRWRFKAVCQESGLTVKDKQGRPCYPRVGHIVGNRDGFRVRIRPLIGQTVAQWEKAAAAFALAYGKTSTRVRDEGDGTLSLLVGYRPMAARDLALTLDRQLPEVSWRAYLQAVVIGRREDGGLFALALIDSHFLIAGQTGSGKGSVIWGLILRLLPAFKAGVVRFWGFDPKRMELSLGRALFGEYYAADPAAVIELLRRAHDEMQRYADRLAGKARRFEPSVEHPLNVLVIDELGYMSALLPDRKLRAEAEQLMSAILALGRSVGFVVVGALQDPRKETLGFRDLFPTRVAMRLPKPMVDLVLGAGMYDAGAQCDLIPPRGAGAGVAFVVDEGSTLPTCIRVDWSSDELIRSAVASLGLPAPEMAAVPELAQVS
jgi:DNA segregation ATPase FtsK/SpoIIIE, S-DNA-T family